MLQQGAVSVGIIEIFLIPIVLLLVAFWIWMIVDCATQEREPDRLVWIIIIVFAGFIGAALYYFIQRPKRIRAASSGQADVGKGPA